MSAVEVLNQIKKLVSKYQVPFGISIWGFTAPGQAKEILVDDEGHLQVDVLTGISATVDKVRVWDGTNYLTIDSSGRIGVSNFPTDYPDSAAQAKLDSILTELQQKLETADLSIEATTKYLQTKVMNLPTDYFKAGQSIGESPFNITKVAGTALTGRDWSGDFEKLQNIDTTLSTRASETTLSGIKSQTDKLQFDASNNLKTVVQNFPTDYFKAGQAIGESPVDVKYWTGTAWEAWDKKIASIEDLAFTKEIGRVGIITSSGGGVIDPRQIRALTSSDVVSAVQSGTWTVGRTWSLGKATDGVSAKVDENILGFQFLATEPTPLTADTPNLYARVDAYKRLLVAAVQSGTWNINAVTSITNPVTVQATDLDIRNLSKTLDEVYAVLRTDAGAAYDARDRNWSLSTTERTPLGSQGQPLQQNATTYELQVDLKALTYGTLPIHEQTPWNPPNLDVLMSSVRDNMNIGRIGNVSQTGEDWTPHIRNIDNISTEKTLSYMAVEESKRCSDATIDDTFAVPSGQTWYVKGVEVTTGKLFLDGDIFIVN